MSKKGSKFVDPTSGTSIQKVNGGYVLAIKGNAGTTCLVIRDDGAMVDVSGAEIIRSDITIAEMYLPHVGGEGLKGRLRQGMFDEAALLRQAR